MRRLYSAAVAQLARIFALIGMAVVFGCWAMYSGGARINRTHSLPKGLYWVVDREPRRGDLVAFWPADTPEMREARRRGYIIPGVYNIGPDGQGYGLLLKKLAAVPGDMVSITDAGVIVNGVLIPNTVPLRCDNIGDPLPVLRFENRRLTEGEALFISDHLPRSYDARYFGVQEMRQIVEVVTPVWTW
jgi:conjugative transfer signal peptidase TraF